VADYVRYVVYEQNLESLRRKRMQRMGVRNTGYNGPRRTFFIFERATRKFQGDIPLWIQYLDYARRQKAHKRVGKILTSVLRLHPTNTNLWIFAARYAVERGGDPSAARGYLQRALRFCPKDKPIWLEYVRLEMLFISKITENLLQLGVKSDEEVRRKLEEQSIDEIGADVIELPDVDLEDINEKALEPLDTQALQNMASTPALSGDIPVAIFDAAMKEFDGDATIAEQFFDIMAEFHKLSCTSRLLKHIVQYLGRQVPATASGAICAFKLPLVGVDTASSKFPLALRHSLQLVRASIVQQHNRQKKLQITEKFACAILPLAVNQEIDSEIQTVIGSVLTQIVKLLGNGENVLNVVESLQTQQRVTEADRLLVNGLKQFSTSKRLQRKYLELHPRTIEPHAD
jgi:U3 small nucleolar RNA-associated protein 6